MGEQDESIHISKLLVSSVPHGPPPHLQPPPPRRKALPAWIRDGLERMEKSKTKIEEEVVSRVAGIPIKEQKPDSKSSIQRNRISGYTVMNDSDTGSDDKVCC